MSKDIDKATMDALAGQGDTHALRVDLDGDTLLAGTVNIQRDEEGLTRAEALRHTLDSVIARLKTILPLLLAICIVSAVAAPSLAQQRKIYAPRDSHERSWGGLTKAELVAINSALRKLPATKIQVFCGGNFCRALAEYFDEAFESAGFDSTIELPMFDLGKGMAISPDNDEARSAAAAIKAATSGRIDLKVIDQSHPVAGRLVIAIGRKPVR
jgi:hypothetical protein